MLEYRWYGVDLKFFFKKNHTCLKMGLFCVRLPWRIVGRRGRGGIERPDRTLVAKVRPEVDDVLVGAASLAAASAAVGLLGRREAAEAKALDDRGRFGPHPLSQGGLFVLHLWGVLVEEHGEVGGDGRGLVPRVGPVVV